LIIWALLIAASASAQVCPKNMLYIPEEGGGVALKGDSLRLDKAMTVEVWVRLNSAADRSTIFEKGNIGRFVNYSLAIGPLNTVVARVLTPTGVVSLSSEFIPDIANWHHYALVFKPGDSLYLYVDGERSAAVKMLSVILSTGDDSLRVGRSIVSGGKNLYGAVDELRIWRIARTQAQIIADKGHVIPKNSAGLVGYLTFDDEATRGIFFENRGLVARLDGQAQLVPSSSPVTGVPPSYKLQAKESSMRLPLKSCVAKFDTVVHVRNLGLDSVHVTEMGLVRGTAFSIAGPERLDLPADSGFYGEIHIQFNPIGSGIYIDTLVIGSSSACAGQIRIPLIDTFVSSSFEILQKQLTITNILNCDLPLTQKVSVKNTGSTTLQIKGYFANDIGMKITSPASFSLAAGEKRDVTIQIDKGPDGFSTTSLVFESDVCQRAISIEATISRETMTYDAPPSVDFGERMILADEIVIDTIVTFRNTSARDITVNRANVTGVTAFVVTPQIFRVTIKPGEELQVPIHFRATTCGIYQGTLHVFGDPCAIDAAIPLRVNVTGPKPTIASVIDLGFTCGAKDTILTLSNLYDSSITLTGYSFSTTGVFSTPTTFPLTIAPNSTKQLELRFRPTIEKEYEVNFTMTNAKCGSMAIKLRGGYGTKAISVTPRVDFGRGCDLSKTRRSVRVTNNSPREAVIAKAAITQSDRYKFVDLDVPMVILPGDSSEFAIEFSPQASAISRGFAGFELAEGCPTSQAELYASREEPVLSIAERSLEFDTLCPSLSKTLDLLVTNSGLDSVDLTYSFASGTGSFTLQNPSSVLKRGANILHVNFAPLANGNYEDTLILSAVACEIVYKVALHGTGGSDPDLAYSNVDLKFGKIEVGTSDVICIIISNPSCTPITLGQKSFIFSNDRYSLDQASLDRLPRTIRNSETLEICVIYAPDTRSIDRGELQVIAPGIDDKEIQLSGQGVAPLLRLEPAELDFGFVPLGEDREKEIEITNSGDLPAQLTVSIVPPAGTFSTETTTLTIAEGESKKIEVEFEPTAATLYTGTIELQGAGVAESVELRGVGSERGLVADKTELEFGDVRVGNSKTDTLVITANVFPTTLNTADLIASADSKYFEVVSDVQLPFTFTAPGDLLRVYVTFKPQEERVMTAALELTTEEQKLSFDLVGRGVDAHIATPKVIDFELAELEITTYKDYTISNTGLYPLRVISASTSAPFEAPNVSAVIAPGDSQTFSVGFTPVTKKEVIGELTITSDGPEGEKKIKLIGRGSDASQSTPRVAYSIPPSISAVIGEQITIPVMISGNKLEQFKSNTFDIEFRYDPWMLYVHGFDASHSVTNGMTIEGKKIDDSTYAIHGTGAPFDLLNGGSLIEIKGEALFGPRERTQMQIVKAFPTSKSSITEAVAELQVTNCHDQAAGAIYKGAYSVEQAFPTPTNASATIAYTLGYLGSAEIEIIDALGRTIKQIQLPERPKGEHTFVLDVSELANGRYSALFRSREFVKRIDLVVEH
jgi:hypothetical protein